MAGRENKRPEISSDHELPKSAGTPVNPRRHAGVGKKKTNRMKGWSRVLVVGPPPTSNLANSAFSRMQKLPGTHAGSCGIRPNRISG